MGEAKRKGDWGEALTASYLKEHGYEIVARQYRCRYGEIDVIARCGELLCFVEVKMRSTTRRGLPREFVDERKRQRIRLAAAMYMQTWDEECPVRFDVAEVYAPEKQHQTPPRLVYLEDAFY